VLEYTRKDGKHIVYLEIPKTGTSTMGSIIHHMGGSSVHKVGKHSSSPTRCSGYTEDSLVVTNIRHPLIMLKSWWNHMTSLKKVNRKERTIIGHQFNKSSTSQDFCHRMVNAQPAYFSDMFKGYTKVCHFVGATELYPETLIKMLGIDHVEVVQLLQHIRYNGLVAENGFTIEPDTVKKFLANEHEAVAMWHDVISGKWRSKI